MRTRLGAALLLVLLAVSVTTGGTITLPYTFSPGTTIQSAQVNSNFSTIYNDYNGNISDANIASVTETKITFTGAGHAHSGGAGGAPVQFVAGSSITSASSITIPTDGNYFSVTGTVTITALSTRTSGVLAILRFAGALTLTHNATSLILPGGANITTTAGDIAIMVSEGSGNWRCLAYQRVTGGAGQSGSYGVRNLIGANNAGTPNTKYDVSADLVQLRNPVDGSTIVRTSVGTVTNDVGVTGPAANGRDQSGAFSASSWVHFYWIWDGTTLTTVSSPTAPPTGPVLPSGYSSWAYIGAVRFNGSSQLVKTRYRGKMAFYVDGNQNAITTGTATSETAVSLTTLVPPNALTTTLGGDNGNNGTANVLKIRVITGAEYLVVPLNVYGGLTQFTIPNISQQFYYFFASGPSNGITLDVNSFTVPNGGD